MLAERDAAFTQGVRRGLETASARCLDIAREWEQTSDGQGRYAAAECAEKVRGIDAASVKP